MLKMTHVLETTPERCFSLSTLWTWQIAFIPIYCSLGGSNLCSWVVKGLMKWTQVPRVPESCLPRALGEQSRGMPTHHRSHAWPAVNYLSQKYLMVICATDLLSSISECQVYSRQLRHTNAHLHWLAEGRICSTRWCNMSLSRRSWCIDAMLKKFWGVVTSTNAISDHNTPSKCLFPTKRSQYAVSSASTHYFLLWKLPKTRRFLCKTHSICPFSLAIRLQCTIFSAKRSLHTVSYCNSSLFSDRK